MVSSSIVNTELRISYIHINIGHGRKDCCKNLSQLFFNCSECFLKNVTSLRAEVGGGGTVAWSHMKNWDGIVDIWVK